MKKILALLIGLALNAHATILVSELPANFDLKQAIDGVYSNSLQDQITVTVTEEEVDLFGPRYYSIIIEGELAQGNLSIELDESHFQRVDDKGTISFFDADDCQDPGCQVHEISLDFKRKRDGSYTMQLNYDGSHEVNENVGYDDYDRYRNGEVTLEDVQAVCDDLYSVVDRGTYATLDSGGAWCYYARVFYLSKK